MARCDLETHNEHMAILGEACQRVAIKGRATIAIAIALALLAQLQKILGTIVVLDIMGHFDLSLIATSSIGEV